MWYPIQNMSYLALDIIPAEQTYPRNVRKQPRPAKDLYHDTVKFVSPSNTTSLESALGQYILYQNIIEEIEPDRTLYPAVHEEVFSTVFEESLGRMIVDKNHLKLLIFDRTEEVIAKWNA